METEHLEKRFGIVAIEKGFITPLQLVSAIEQQLLDDVERGVHRIIGRILVEQGIMTMEQVDDVLNSMGKGLPLLKEL